ncbi:MAG: radical SAM family heme chaperone HemW [Clostridiaceae bacterium]|nr:radical SAM family heme chaperone HemW [Clostridiaceae bacterium]
MSAGIYIHVPFCVRKCGYCDFYSLPRRGSADFDAYTDALIAEIEAETPGISTDTVYFGGGTPSLLGAPRLSRILDAVRDTFDVSPDAEITLEANPLDVSRPDELTDAGFNRLSLGVQSANDAELSLLGRRHTFADARETVKIARAAGVTNLSLDLMYGLPNQTTERWEASVHALLELAPEHISCYALKLSEGVPLYRMHDALPDDDTQLAMYLSLIGMLADAGYRQYEISNFSLPGRESRHNSKYWLGEPYYGFGPGAHSFFGGDRYACPADLAGYLRGKVPRQLIEEKPDAREEYIILRLRMTEGIRASDYETCFGEAFAPYAVVLDRYLPYGLTARDGDRRYLTPRGMFVSNAILEELIELL